MLLTWLRNKLRVLPVHGFMVQSYVICDICTLVAEMSSKEQQDAIKECTVLKVSYDLLRLLKHESWPGQELNHPNIIAYHESFVHEGVLHIIMDYAAGGDLSEVIRKVSSSGVPWSKPAFREVSV